MSIVQWCDTKPLLFTIPKGKSIVVEVVDTTPPITTYVFSDGTGLNSRGQYFWVL